MSVQVPPSPPTKSDQRLLLGGETHDKENPEDIQVQGGLARFAIRPDGVVVDASLYRPDTDILVFGGDL